MLTLRRLRRHGERRLALRERMLDVAAVLGVIAVWLLVWVLVPIGSPPPGVDLR